MADQAEDNQNSEDNSQDNSENENTEITLESVDSFDAENLTEDQTKFLQENADSLTDEQKETYKAALEAKEEDEEEIDVDKVEPETRGGKKVEKKDDDADKGKKGDEDEEDDLDEDEEKKITKVVDKKLTPVAQALEQLQEIKDQNEVEGFIRLNPNYSKYREVALKYMKHPAYSQIPVKNIMAMVAADSLQKLGAAKEREAAKKAKDTKGGGGQQRSQSGGKVDWANMPKADFEAKKAEVMQGGRS